MPLDDGGSVTRWIGELRDGDPAAARRGVGALLRSPGAAGPQAAGRARMAGSRTRKTRRFPPLTASARDWPEAGSPSWPIATTSGSCWS